MDEDDDGYAGLFAQAAADEAAEEATADDCEKEPLPEEEAITTADIQLNSEDIDPDIVATVAALGSTEGSNYVKGDECAICIGDLIKYLRFENKKTCDVRRQLAKIRVMEKDLLPILTTYFDDPAILEAMMKLLVNLTMPVLLCFEKEESTKKDSLRQKLYIEVNSYLRVYKHHFVLCEGMKVFSSQLATLLQLGKSNRTDDDDLMLERILITIRNLLHVPSDTNEEHDLQNSLTSHDKLVLSMVEFGVTDLLFYLSGNAEEEQHCLLALETISLIFRDFEPSVLAQANTGQDQIRIDRELEDLKRKEDMKKLQKKNMKSTRHSRFGGTFVMKGKKSITDKDLIYHKNIKKIRDLSFDDEKQIRRHTGYHSIAEDTSHSRHSTPKTRSALKDLAIKFLEVCYNPLMKKTKSLLCRGQGTAGCDETFYLWACAFFMEFNRVHDFKLDVVAETLSIDSFSYILQITFRFHEEIKGYNAKMVHLKKTWAKRLHGAIRSYREMLENLSIMLISKDSKIRNIANVVQGNIFYQQEYRELPTMLLKQFEKRVFTRSYLIDLVECTHLYIRMLDAYTKNNTLIVQETKKVKKKGGGKKKKKRKNLLSEDEMKEMWEGDIEGEVTKILAAGNISTSNVSPFDASLDHSLEQQRVLCKHNIQDLLKSGSFGEAVALFKAAAEVWPSSPSFGMPDMSIIDEVNVVRSIFLSREELPDFLGDDEEPAASTSHHRGEESEFPTEMHQVKESRFQNNNYLMLYARPAIVQCYCYLLESFESNPPSTNRALVKMLYRLASKLAMTPIMFQMSFFITVRKILAAPKMDSYKDLQRFAAFIVRRFVTALKESPMICIDTLFWKTTDDVVAIDVGYDQDKIPGKKHAVSWTPPEEAELRQLFEKWLDKAQAVDICDMIAQDMTTSTDKQRMDVKKKILELGLVGEENQDILKKKPKSAADWLPDEREALRSLYEEYRYERDPVALIQEKLDTKTRKKIVKELENLLGVRKADLDPARSIWTRDEDEELKILYEHRSETHSGDALLEAIQDKLPKARTVKEIKDALVRLKLRRDESSSEHFWTKGELEVVERHRGLLSKKEMILKIRQDLPDLDYSTIIQQLVRAGDMSTVQGAELLIQCSDLELDEEEEDEEEEEEEEFDFFDIPTHVRALERAHGPALRWITRLCEDAVEARESLMDYDTVFIVPKCEAHHEALRVPAFKDLLRCLGAVPPLSSYETFWKITGDISDNVLKRALALLQGDDEGSSDDLDTITAPPPEEDDEEEGDIDNFFEKMRSQKPVDEAEVFQSRDRSRESSVEELPSTSTSDKENFQSTGKRKQTLDDSDSDSEMEVSVTKKKRTAVVAISDSDDE